MIKNLLTNPAVMESVGDWLVPTPGTTRTSSPPASRTSSTCAGRASPCRRRARLARRDPPRVPEPPLGRVRHGARRRRDRPIRIKARATSSEGGDCSRPTGTAARSTPRQGTPSGRARGVVLSKRLADAIADGDHVHAVIRGSADQQRRHDKVGYPAPSVTGQTRAIAEALGHRRGSTPRPIGYVEAHGTGTRIGDPIEIAGLARRVPSAHRREAVLRDRIAQDATSATPARRRARRGS